MKICFILSHDTKFAGTPMVVKNISKSVNSEIISGRGFGFIKTFLYPFIIPFLIYRKKFDIINVHDTEGYACTFFPRLCKKMIYTSHGVWKTYIRIMKPSFLNRIKIEIAARMQKRILKKSVHITAVSNVVKNEIIKYYKIDPSKITVIHNGVDTKKFYPKRKNKGNVAIWVGDNPELKNLEKTISYCKKNKLKLIAVGIDGKNNKHVKFLGKIPNNRMPEIYQTTDILLFFSKMEGHPLVPMEAMACGLDVVASNESNIEIVPRQKDGSYKINGKRARKIILKYDWKNQAKKYLKIFEKVSSKNKISRN